MAPKMLKLLDKFNNWKMESKLLDLLRPRRKSIRAHLNHYQELDGYCNKCGDHTSVLNPCCGGGVWFEGGNEDWESILDEVCECRDHHDSCYACQYREYLV